MTARTRALTVVVAVLALTSCGSDPEESTRPSQGQRSGTSADDLPTVLLFDFDAVETPLVEGSRIRGTGSRAADGVVHVAGPSPQAPTALDGRSGQALSFPAPCTPTATAMCPRAIIEIAMDPDLATGDEDFGFGASVLLAPDQTSKGSNVVQKGFSRGGGGQWKLQVDGIEGLPSCVLVGLDDSTIHQARSELTVADGRWHDVACRRDGDALVIRVDGAERARSDLPADLVVEPAGPVRIAGKNLKQDNDQYFGAVDDVFLEAATD